MKVLDSVFLLRSLSRQFCALRKMLHSLPKYKSCCWLIGLLSCHEVISLSVLWTLQSLILLWSLLLWLLLRNTGLTPIAHSYRQYSRLYCKLLWERDISSLKSVKKMQLSIPIIDSVNVALDVLKII